MNAHKRPLGSPVEIAFWLGTCHQVPSVDDIENRWEVSRSTAFRWRAFALAGGQSQQSGRAYSNHSRQPRRRA